MTVLKDHSKLADPIDVAVAGIVEEIIDRMIHGNPVDLDYCVEKYPEHAEQLRELWPTIRLLADFSRSSEQPAVSQPFEVVPGNRTIGDFRILQEIGRGGMGVVFEAIQLSLNRQVALKVLPFASAFDPRQLQRFKIEAQAVAHLHHKNIVPIYAVGSSDGVHFYAMQFIRGRNLAELIDDRLKKTADPPSAKNTSRAILTPDDARSEEKLDANALTVPYFSENLSPAAPSTKLTLRSDHVDLTQHLVARREYHRQVANWGIQAAEALDHAHQQGIVHRDVKPGNLMLDEHGYLWVTDFGLAHIQNDSKLTVTGDMVGTLRYMSPEQALAKRAIVDHRSDIYSLGVTLYELLAMQPALSGDDRQELLHRIAHIEPRPLRSLDKSIPRDLETVIQKASAKEPHHRYGTAQELADDLNRFLNDEPILAKKPTMLQNLVKWAKRHRELVAAVMVFTFLLAVISPIVAFSQYSLRSTAEEEAKLKEEQKKKADEKTREASKQTQLALTNAAKYLRERNLKEDQLYISNIALTYRAWDAGDIRGAWQRLQTHLPQPGGRDLRGWEWHFLSALCRRHLVECKGHIARIDKITWSPDGSQLATCCVDDTFRVWDANTGIEQFRVSRGNCTWATIAWSPDGKKLAISHSTRPGGNLDSLSILDGQTGNFLLTVFTLPERITSISWHPDGKQLVTISCRGAVSLWNLATRKRQVLHGPAMETSCTSPRIAWSPDGIHLALMQGSGNPVGIWQTNPKKQVVTLADNDVREFQWSPNGKTLATAGPKNSVKIWDAKTGKEVRSFYAPGNRSVDWNLKGGQIAAAVKNFVRIWDSKSGDDLLTIRAHQTGVRDIAWSPDGKRLATAATSGEIKIWSTDHLQQALRLPGHHGRVTGLHWNPKLPLMASESRGSKKCDRTIRIWNMATGKEQFTFPGITSFMGWSADGEHFLMQNKTSRAIYATAGGKKIASAGDMRSPAYSPDGRLAYFTDVSLKLTRQIDAREIPAILPGGKTSRNLKTDGQRGVEISGPCLKIIDAETHKELLSLPTSLNKFAWSPSGLQLALMSKDELALISSTTGKETAALSLPTMRLSTASRPLWSPDERYVACWSNNGSMIVWNCSTGESQTLIALGGFGKNNDKAVAQWAPSGSLLAVAGPDHTISIWNAEKGEAVHRLAGHLDEVNDLQWSPDGKRLASAGRVVKIWDPKSGQELLSLAGPFGQIHSLQWSPDGKKLACGSGEGPIWLFDAAPRDGKWQATIHSLPARSASPGLNDVPANKKTVLQKAEMIIQTPNKNSPQDVSQCIEMLSDPNPAVRWQAVQALDKHGSPAIPHLLQMLEQNKRGDSCTQAILMLGKLGPAAKDAVPAIERLAMDKRKSVSDASVYCLMKIGPQAISALSRLSQDRDRDRQMPAMRALAGIGEASVPALCQLAGHQDKTISLSALQTLKLLGKKAAKAVPTLRSFLSQANTPQQYEAVRVLGEIGPQAKDAVPDLVALLHDQKAPVFMEAVKTLGKIGNTAHTALPALIQLHQTTNGYRRYAVANTIKQIDPKTAMSMGIR